MLCTNCGRSGLPENSFCPSCGRKAAATDGATPSHTPGFHRPGDLDYTRFPDTAEAGQASAQSDSFSFPGLLSQPLESSEVAMPAASAYANAEARHVVAPPVSGRRCPNCGELLGIDTKFCPRCGQPAQPASAAKKRLYKPLLIAATCVLLVAVAVGVILHLSGPKSAGGITKDIESHLSSVTVERESIPIRIKQLDIQDRKTRDGTDTVYCQAVLESDFFEITAFLELGYIRYDRNDWLLESISSYAPDQIEITNTTEAMRSEVLSSIRSTSGSLQNFDHLIDHESTGCFEDSAAYSFQISGYSGMKEISGTVLTTLNMGGSCLNGY